MREIEEKFKDIEKKIEDLNKSFDIEGKKRELKNLELKIQTPDFWQREKDAAKIQREFSTLAEKIQKIESLKKEIKELKEFLTFVKEKKPASAKATAGKEEEIKQRIKKLDVEIKNCYQEIFLVGPHDKNSAILSIEAGAGGRDAEDWAAILKKIYERYCERKNFNFRILHQNFSEGGGPEGRIGIKEITMEIKGKLAYGLLKKETGVHRLVRISPFSAKSLRHTSFAKIEVLPEIESQDEKEINIRPEDLKIETFRASGPGGQYVNKRESAVRITHLPTGIHASSQVERLQGMNRKIAEKVLIAKLAVLREKERRKEIEKIKGKKVDVEFGNQIRSYIFHPYKLIKDHRTGIETSDIASVMDGDLDRFIEGEIAI